MATVLGKGSYGKVMRRGNRAVKSCEIGDVCDDLPCWSACAREFYCGGFHHLNICKRYKVSSKQTVVHIHMEIGRPLNVAKTDPFRLLVNVGAGLQFLHANGIMHRDVKPQNIIVVRGVHKLIDFGLARPPTTNRAMLTGYTISRWWRPPELLNETETVYTGKCDMWSLGVVYYQTIFHDVPFRGTVEEMLDKIKTFEPVGILRHLLVPVSERYTSTQLVEWTKRTPERTPVAPERDEKLAELPDDVAKVVSHYKYKSLRSLHVAVLLGYLVCGYDSDAQDIALEIQQVHGLTQEKLLRKLVSLKRIW